MNKKLIILLGMGTCALIAEAKVNFDVTYEDGVNAEIREALEISLDKFGDMFVNDSNVTLLVKTSDEEVDTLSEGVVVDGISISDVVGHPGHHYFARRILGEEKESVVTHDAVMTIHSREEAKWTEPSDYNFSGEIKSNEYDFSGVVWAGMLRAIGFGPTFGDFLVCETEYGVDIDDIILEKCSEYGLKHALGVTLAEEDKAHVEEILKGREQAILSIERDGETPFDELQDVLLQYCVHQLAGKDIENEKAAVLSKWEKLDVDLETYLAIVKSGESLKRDAINLVRDLLMFNNDKILDNQVEKYSELVASLKKLSGDSQSFGESLREFLPEIENPFEKLTINMMAYLVGEVDKNTVISSAEEVRKQDPLMIMREIRKSILGSEVHANIFDSKLVNQNGVPLINEEGAFDIFTHCELLTLKRDLEVFFKGPNVEKHTGGNTKLYNRRTLYKTSEMGSLMGSLPQVQRGHKLPDSLSALETAIMLDLGFNIRNKHTESWAAEEVKDEL